MTSLLLVGAGRMGSALLARLQQKNLLQSIHIIDPHGAVTPASCGGLGTSDRSCGEPEIPAQGGDDASGIVSSYNKLEEYTETPDIVLFAIKPQMLDAELPKYAARFGTKSLYISIAAGKPVAFYEKHLGAAKIVRAMPNTPSMIGEGMTGLFANTNVTAAEKQTATQLFDAVGKTVWLESEELMHALSAVSGSGPAFVFAFMEALVGAGVKAGLSQDAATALVLQTFKGASDLAATSSDSLSTLRENVTSPGGMTAAGLNILSSPLKGVVDKTVSAAIAKSKTL